MMTMLYNHPFHLVTMSPWPILNAFNLMNLMMSLIMWFYLNNYNLMLLNFITLILSMYLWWRDIIRESTYQGFHTMYVLMFLKFSMILFIISEMMFFISFFWTLFHSSIAPNIEIGMNWPPKNILIFNPYEIPLLNSLILIYSGMVLTWSHHAMLNNNLFLSMKMLKNSMMLGVYFSLLQYIEYMESFFSINDSIFGSIFFMMTGFHGLHVIIGILFLFTSLIRMYKRHFSLIHHFHFEAASWYWHFVDVIWLFLYIFLYWWN
uniref:Cytochrome c oxidase subunit 3 n=1 Tax=Euaspis polynesia TaxID=1352276 RepID=A0A7T4WNX8_9HYME|nr:cytochrome c oxidase subunit III [Euaspis polynesia]QQD78161.1 cytochrome c oxidase subunit 3 [Euaspis polynesia]